MNFNTSIPIRLNGHLQSYAWGKGAGCLVAKLSGLTAANGHYSELWYGTHPSGPSTLSDDPATKLHDLINSHSATILGKSVAAVDSHSLPFLFKFLSIARPLSIQVHPNAATAKMLNIDEPHLYKDPYPKPEVGIALTTSSLLCGFKKPAAIIKYLHPGPEFAPELADLLGLSLITKLESALTDQALFLRTITSAVLFQDQLKLQQLSAKLFGRLQAQKLVAASDTWLLKLAEYYPQGDAGLFFFYLLNLIELKPGDAIYIKPGTIHAYLDGELAECMAPSDNVLRAGLTTKPVDPKRVLEITSFSSDDRQNFELFTSKNSKRTIFPKEQEFFKLTELNCHPEPLLIPDNHLALAVCASGTAEISYPNGALALDPGQAVLVPASAKGCSISAKKGYIFVIFTP